MKLKKTDYDWCYKKMKYWQKELGVMDRELFLQIEEIEGKCGQCSFDLNAMHATISVSNVFDFKNRIEVEKTIFHEVCEAMMSEIYITMSNHNITDGEQDRLGHSIIRRLENLMFK